ncbi:hypothetical protein N7448_003627 [Penicillium atrosanguineum]|uniref:Proteasome maturation factor UMP1 n=1 Tax=Penicillium atrosanguineum TaxID=1132637 RepID=A0A9W9L7D8_9EURO|nr:37S ribosomal protein S12 [Penicillium atrosanguineum]KAJ5122493.1 hypothetical protein N7526_009430 [Penicillium atrosanguineum]KAJ5140219.1 hypothetical protein N7448_003627 [Penicillium atrosanguineum]KAJ5310136.1 37S ribosomal protein S12 [Penicillium atrosanguineum]KAJ5315652.1 hypothetical protein N7476_005959 [Penicillium atrosanguineum]
MSLRIAPPSGNPSSTTNTTTRQTQLSKGAPSAPGLPDTLRNKITLPATATASSTNTPALNDIPSSTHPLEARLLAWRATQDALKMESLRRAYGIAEPVRRGMELKIVRDSTFRPAVLGGMKGGNIHEDILTLGGRDSEVSWEDIFPGDEFREPPTFHDEMEKRLKMDF